MSATISTTVFLAVFAVLIPDGQQSTLVTGGTNILLLKRTEEGFFVTSTYLGGKDPTDVKLGSIKADKNAKGVFTIFERETVNVDDFRKALKPLKDNPKQEIEFRGEKFVVSAERNGISLKVGKNSFYLGTSPFGPDSRPTSQPATADATSRGPRVYKEGDSVIAEMQDGTEAVVRLDLEKLKAQGVADAKDSLVNTIIWKLRTGRPADIGSVTELLTNHTVGIAKGGAVRQGGVVRLGDVIRIESRKANAASSPASQPATSPAAPAPQLSTAASRDSSN